MATVEDIKLHSIVSFTSKDTNDHNMYKGKIIGADLSYEAVRSSIDTYTKTANVNATHSNINLIPETLNYFIILNEDNAGGEPNQVIFAKEWVDTINLHDTEKNRILKVFGVSDNEIVQLLDLIKSNGHVVELIKED